MERRQFIHQAAAASFVAAAANSLWASDRIRAPRILLRSSWQVVNIGDIAHTPGVLALLEKHLPEAEVILRVVRETELKVLLCPEDMTQMTVGNGIPAIVCRFEEQTSKGIMWRDIGLGEWLFNLDVQSEAARVADSVVAMAKNPQAAKAKTEVGRAYVLKRQKETMDILKQQLTVE